MGNLAGLGAGAGRALPRRRDIRETRGSLHLPALGRSGDITASVFRLDEDFHWSARRRASGCSPRHEIQRASRSSRHPARGAGTCSTATASSASEPRAQLDQNLSGLEVSVLRETRDDPLDARQRLVPEPRSRRRFLGSDFSTSARSQGSWRARSAARDLGAGLPPGLAHGLDEQAQQVSVFGRSTELSARAAPTPCAATPPIPSARRARPAASRAAARRWRHEPGDPLAASLGGRRRGVLGRRQRLRAARTSA